MISPLIVAIAVLVLFVLLDTKNPLYSDIFIFLYFLFALPNIEGSKEISIFYLLMLLFYLAFRLSKHAFAVKNEGINNSFAGFSLKGRIPWMGILLGAGLFIVMYVLQATQTASIFGVPTLAIREPLFGVSSIMLLGVVENRMFFTTFEFLVVSGILSLGGVLSAFGVAAPLLFTAGLFSVFHLFAYSLAAGSLLFAGIVFMGFLGVYLINGDDLGPNIAHMLWNGVFEVRRSLSIVF